MLHFGVPFQAIEQRTATAAGPVRFLTTNLLRLQDNQQRTIGVLCLVEDSHGGRHPAAGTHQRQRAKDQFLAQLSHELRNPLSPVITMVAELEVYAEALPATREPLEIIRRNVELEARLIDDLLDVTRISSGKLQLATETVDVHRMMALALEICQRDIEDKELRLELELRARDHYAVADPARLQQVFWNLIKNAVKFTPDRWPDRGAFEQSHRHARRAGAGAWPRRTSIFTKVPETAAKSGGGERRDHPRAGAAGPRDFCGSRSATRASASSRSICGGFSTRSTRGRAPSRSASAGWGWGWRFPRRWSRRTAARLTVAERGRGQGGNVYRRSAHLPRSDRGKGGRRSGRDAVLAANTVPTPANGAKNGGAPATEGQSRRVLLVDDHVDTCLGMQRLLNRRGYQVVVAHSVAEAIGQGRGRGAFRPAHQRSGAAGRFGLRPDEQSARSAAVRRGSR